MANLAGLEHRGHALDLFMNRGARFFFRRIELGGAEIGHVALRPVNLVKVDVIGAQPREAGIHRLRNHTLGEIGAAVAYPVAPPRPGDLGGDDQALAILASEPGAEIFFRESLCFRIRRYRIHFRSVDEVDALADGMVKLLVRLRFAVLLAPGHGAQAHTRYVQISAGKDSELHGGLRFDNKDTSLAESAGAAEAKS